ncbi:putative Casein kinase I [Blattamonas nauphoetae]|uniref:non-specific serine/threonine protein kinase n=1 Tax=Blattamonas nauphoetae TaxID=2049346 RepID=A0ABQ9WU82_9EUKA|nr:putative Casein kinase I [Blattamonas nauphoetae]
MSRIEFYNLPSVLHKRFRIHRSKQIGEGSFGSILSCTDIHTGEDLAVKVEENSKDSHLRYEHHILKRLRLFPGFPSVYCHTQSDTHSFVVMTRLGSNLEEIWKENGGAFSLATLAHVGIQAVTLLERLHTVGYLHRDIKPENFMFGKGDSRQELFLIDFGLSKRFQREQDGEHIGFRTGKMMTGTPRYASVSAHLGMEQGRKDDLVSLFNVLVFLLEGRLPWMGIAGSTESEKCAMIQKVKMQTCVESFSNLPLPLATFFNCVSALPFSAVPPYAFLRALLLDVGRLDTKALTRYGSDVFSTEQRFLRAYHYEWLEEYATQTVLLGEDKDISASPVVKLELPQLKRPKIRSLGEGGIGSHARTRSKSTPLLPLIENGPLESQKWDNSDGPNKLDRISQISPNSKGRVPLPAVHNPDSSSLIPLSTVCVNQSITTPSPMTLGKCKSTSILDTAASHWMARPSTKSGDLSRQWMPSRYLHAHCNRNVDKRQRSAQTSHMRGSMMMSPKRSDSPIFASSLFSAVSNVLPTHPPIHFAKNVGRAGLPPTNTSCEGHLKAPIGNEAQLKDKRVGDAKQSEAVWMDEPPSQVE